MKFVEVIKESFEPESRFNQEALKALANHLKEGSALCESPFRHGSQSYLETFIYAKKLREAGSLPELDWESEEMLSTDIGESVVLKGGERVWLDVPYMYESEDPEEDNMHQETAMSEMRKLAGLPEAEYQGKDVELNKPKRGGSKKYYVYVKNPKTGNVKKISFGDPGLKTKSGNKGRAKSFAARHNCEKKNDKTKAGYWACRLPRYGLVKGGKWW